MKKLLLWILTFALLLPGLSVPATADVSLDFNSFQAPEPQKRMVVRNEALSSYLDGNGNLFITGHDIAVNKTAADELISIDAYHVLFTRHDEAADTDTLVALNLSDMSESIISDSVHAA